MRYSGNRPSRRGARGRRMEERAAVAGRRVTLYTPLPRLTGPEGPRILPAEGSVDLLAVLESGTQENRKMHQTCAFPDSLSSRLISSGNITTDPEGSVDLYRRNRAR